jgi:hypothetical protein
LNALIFLKIFFAGIAILLAAILLNMLASSLGLQTWYTFLNAIEQQGLASTLKMLKVTDYFFLFLTYPFLLGLSAYLIFRLGGT